MLLKKKLIREGIVLMRNINFYRVDKMCKACSRYNGFTHCAAILRVRYCISLGIAESRRYYIRDYSKLINKWL